MFDGESVTSKKNVGYFDYSKKTEGGSTFWCVIGDDSEHRVLHEQIRTLEWVKREKIENAANSETIYVVGAGQDVGVDDDVTMAATVDGGTELDMGDGGKKRKREKEKAEQTNIGRAVKKRDNNSHADMYIQQYIHTYIHTIKTLRAATKRLRTKEFRRCRKHLCNHLKSLLTFKVLPAKNENNRYGF